MSVRAELIKVAVFAAVGLLLAGLLVVTLGRSTVGVVSTDYQAEFADVSGLQDGDLVRIAGVTVGQVARVSMAEGNRVLVEFDVENAQPITESTRLLVRYENLIGDRYLELAPGAGGAAPQDPDRRIDPRRTVPALDLDVLLNGFKPLFQGLEPDQVNELAGNIVSTLQGRSGTVESLLVSTGSLTGALADRDEVIGRVVTNLNTVLQAVDDRDGRLSQTIGELQELVSGLAEDREIVGGSIEQIGGFAEDLSGLLERSRPPLRGTVSELGRLATVLDDNSDSLDAVLAQIPVAHDSLRRVGSYGSFFNFYLCSVQVTVTGPDGLPIRSPVFGSNQNTPRCRVP